LLIITPSSNANVEIIFQLAIGPNFYKNIMATGEMIASKYSQKENQKRIKTLFEI
jgi:hypothetical protein